MSAESAETMTRDTAVTFYVEDETHAALKDEARQADETLSTYVHGLVQGARHAETREEKSRELNAEERIEALIADGRDQLLSIGREIEERNDTLAESIQQRNEAVADMVARAGVYSIANFELLKRGVDDPVRQSALSTGARRLRSPLAEHDDTDDVDADRDDGPADSRGDDSDSGSGPSSTGTDDLYEDNS